MTGNCCLYSLKTGRMGQNSWTCERSITWLYITTHVAIEWINHVTSQGPSAPFGRWMVGGRTSDVSAVRWVHSEDVDKFSASSPPQLSRLPRGWRWSRVGELERPITSNYPSEIFQFLPRYIHLSVLNTCHEFHMIFFRNVPGIAYFVKGSYSDSDWTMISAKEIDKPSTPRPLHNSVGCDRSKS